MTGKWSSQRGHASFTPVPLNPPSPWVMRRLGLALGAAGVLGVGLLLAWRLLPSLGAVQAQVTEPALGPLSTQPAQASGATSSGVSVAMAAAAPALPSLIESAQAKVQHLVESVEGKTADPLANAGLQRVSLDDEQFRAIQRQIGNAEARLIDVYRLIGEGDHREALKRAESLAADHPNYQLAQLVLGDLISMYVRPVGQVGDVQALPTDTARTQLAALREESRRRLQALVERPPEGAIPTQFVALSPQNRHAIAIDTSRSRLYLFENKNGQARLMGDYYISVGLLGVEKFVEGDKRTPLGVYFITSSLDPNSLPDLYGAGALPINYPNPLDLQRGKTGSGIWLHGTPREQFVRAPQASDGCVVMSNQDLRLLLSTVSIRTTPVVIARELQWVQPEKLNSNHASFDQAFQAWQSAKSEGQLSQLRRFYSTRFAADDGSADRWWQKTESELRKQSRLPGGIELKDVSILHWQDEQETMVVTFGEIPQGQRRGVTRRQYWTREGQDWKIFYEGTV